MDSLLRALFSQMERDADPFGGADPEKILASMYGPMGASGGSPYGMYGSMFGGMVPQMTIPSPLKAFAPTNDPAFLALLGK